MLRLGISSYTYGWAVGAWKEQPALGMTAEDLIERAAQFGARVLQLADNLPADVFQPDRLVDLKQRADEKRVALELGTRGCQPDHLVRFASLAATAGSPILRVVLDQHDDEPSIEEAVRRIKQALPAFEKNRVILGIENHDRFNAAALISLINACESDHIGITLDTANGFGAMEGPEITIQTLAPRTVNLHLKDVTVRRLPYLQGFSVEGRPAGEGRLDIPGLVRYFSEMPRELSAIAELWVPPEERLEATIQKEARWAEQSFTYLRTLIPH
jgi:3-oxoisoapionate decarboxylase